MCLASACTNRTSKQHTHWPGIAAKYHRNECVGFPIFFEDSTCINRARWTVNGAQDGQVIHMLDEHAGWETTWVHLGHATWQRGLISHIVKFDEFSKKGWETCRKCVGEKNS